MYAINLLAIGGLAAFAVAAPAPAPEPTAMPAPNEIRAAIVARQTSASEYSVQPLMSAPASISLGDLNPSSIIASISASCADGCAGLTTTVTATSVPSPTSQSGIATPTPISIEYVVNTDIIPADQYTVFMDALNDMLAQPATSQDSFTYNFLQPSVYGPPVNDYQQQTNNYAPQQIQFTRYTADSYGNYTDIAGTFSMAITSQVVQSSNSGLCDEIAGPLGSALDEIPEVGGVFGIIGDLVCDGVDSGS